jgi:murein DD-endopeptidase MepM/ murein hydrolase activator NlpD
MLRARVIRAGRKAVGALAVACLIASTTLPFAATTASAAVLAAPAVSTADRDKILDQVRRELAESTEAMVQAAAALRRAETELPGARRAAADARNQLAAAQRRVEAASVRHGAAQTQLMLATRDAEDSAALVETQRVRIGRLARAAYQRGGAMGDVSLLLEARSPAEFTERLVALQTVLSSQRSALSDLQDVQTDAGRQTGTLEQIRDEVAASHEQAQLELRAVAEIAERARQAEESVRSLVTQQRSALAAALAARAEDEQRMAGLHAESSRLSVLLAQRARELLGAAGAIPGASTPVQPGVLIRPVGGPVTSPFGMRVHPITGVTKLHTGTDFGAACGTPIRAARAGTVLAAEFNTAYGWRTVIIHGVVGGVLLTTTYNHQQYLGVDPGQQVQAGEVIGNVGTTGYSTGCHLHFELIVNSDVVDPLPWIAGG